MKKKNQFQLINTKSQDLKAIYYFKGFPILNLITGAHTYTRKQEIMSIIADLHKLNVKI